VQKHSDVIKPNVFHGWQKITLIEDGVMKVFVTGGTGFVGTEIIDKLISEGHDVLALVRGDSSRLDTRTEAVKGDILKPETFSDYLEGVDAVINLVGIIREIPSKGVTFENMHFKATKNVVDASVKHGVKRFIQMSANGTRANAVSGYHIYKYEAEEYIKKSGLDYTIFRPSLVYGPKDSFINMLAKFMRTTPAFSYFGDGSYPMQPVSVYEVADIFVGALSEEKTVGQTYSVCGNKVYTYKELLRAVSTAMGRKHLFLPVPEIFIKMGIGMFGKTSWFPITKDQFIMLTEGNACDNREIFDILNIESQDFEKVISYLKK